MTDWLELNAFQPVRRLVHLEKHRDRHPAKPVTLEHDIDIAVAEIERSAQPHGLRAELADQRVRCFAPVSSVEQSLDPVPSERRPRHQQDGCRRPDLRHRSSFELTRRESPVDLANMPLEQFYESRERIIKTFAPQLASADADGPASRDR